MFAGRNIGLQYEFDAFVRLTIRNAVSNIIKKRRTELRLQKMMVNIDDVEEEIPSPYTPPNAERFPVWDSKETGKIMFDLGTQMCHRSRCRNERNLIPASFFV